MRVWSGSLLAIVVVACSGKSKSDEPFGVDKVEAGAGGSGGTVSSAGRGGSSGGTAGRPSAGRTSTSGAGGSGGMAQSGAGLGGTSAGMSAGGTGGSSAGMSSSAGRSGGGRGNVGAGGDGATSSGATGGSSGEAGSNTGGGSGKGGAGPMPGFRCYTGATCQLGERCIACKQGGTSGVLCAPDPDQDPSGYQTATASCDTVTNYTDCDGPEDCPNGEYCVYGSDPQSSGAKCQSDPAPAPATCCFTCDSVPVCTLCWNDTDCPDGYLCVANPAAPNGVGGCHVAD